MSTSEAEPPSLSDFFITVVTVVTTLALDAESGCSSDVEFSVCFCACACSIFSMYSELSNFLNASTCSASSSLLGAFTASKLCTCLDSSSDLGLEFECECDSFFMAVNDRALSGSDFFT